MSTYMSEFEALPPQEVPRRLKDLVDQWLGLTLSLFDETPQVKTGRTYVSDRIINVQREETATPIASKCGGRLETC